MPAPLHVIEKPPILEITLDRPPANAIDSETSREMGALFERFRDDQAYRVAILTGAGDRFFSAGWDLEAAAAGEAFESDFGPGGFGGFPELPGLNKPVIAAVNGLAVGGGFEIVLAADLAVAADHAELFLPEALVGMIPDAGSIRLPRLLPGPVAREMLLTGRRMTAAEAHGWGLVNDIVPGAELLPVARALAAKLCEAAPLATEAILDLISQAAHLSLDEAFELLRSGNLESYQRMLASSDAQEGPRAFVEERPPNWKGR